MSYPTLPNFQVIGVAMSAQITAFNTGTGAFTFTTAGTSYSANWNTDVIANAINTIGRTVGSTGRLNLTAAKATNLRLSGWKSAGSNYGGVDYDTYTLFNASVRSVTGSSVSLTIGGNVYTVDWNNPGHVWTGAETSITPTVGSSGHVRLGDAFGRSAGLIGGADKWPATLWLRGATELRVQVREGRRVVVLGSDGQTVRDARGAVGEWLLPDTPEVHGFDPVHRQPQIIAVSHRLRAALGLP